jgi:hypothetical protein
MDTLKIAISALALSGCVQQGVPVKDVLHTLECSQWRPIYLPANMPEPPPAWMDGLVQDVLVHNEFGEARECW